MDPLVDLADESSAGMLHVRAKSGEALPKIVSELRKLRQEQLLAPLAAPGKPQPSSPPFKLDGKLPVLKSLSRGGTTTKGAAAKPVTAVASRSAPQAQARSSSQVAQRRQSDTSAMRRSVSSSRTGGALRAAARVSVAAGVAAAPAEGTSSLVASRPSSSTSTKSAASSRGGASQQQTAASGSSTPVGFFVYGTLRPDDDSGAAWTKDFCEEMRSEPAVLKGASMYIDGAYAAVSFEETRCVVRGALLRPQSGKKQAEAMRQKLAEADRIEGFPSLYERAAVTVTTESGAEHLAYVYHRTGRTEREKCLRIADGDWLSRPRQAQKS